MSTSNSTQHYRGRVISVTVDDVTLPNGRQTALEVVHHPGGAAIVAINDLQQVCLLRQYRYVAGGWIWELPAMGAGRRCAHQRRSPGRSRIRHSNCIHWIKVRSGAGTSCDGYARGHRHAAQRQLEG